MQGMDSMTKEDLIEFINEKYADVKLNVRKKSLRLKILRK